MDCSEWAELALSTTTNTQWEESKRDCKMSNENKNNNNQSFTLISEVSYIIKDITVLRPKPKTQKLLTYYIIHIQPSALVFRKYLIPIALNNQ